MPDNWSYQLRFFTTCCNKATQRPFCDALTAGLGIDPDSSAKKKLEQFRNAKGKTLNGQGNHPIGATDFNQDNLDNCRKNSKNMIEDVGMNNIIWGCPR